MLPARDQQMINFEFDVMCIVSLYNVRAYARGLRLALSLVPMPWCKKSRRSRHDTALLIETYTSSSNSLLAYIFDFRLLWTRVVREYWMIYRRPCFLAVVWLGSSPYPPHPFLVSKQHTGRLIKRDDLPTGEGGGVGGANHSTASKPCPL